MKFRQATRDDHPDMQDTIELPGMAPIHTITEGWVTDNEEGPRYWIMNRPYACGQTRLQIWHERQRGELMPEIFSEL